MDFLRYCDSTHNHCVGNVVVLAKVYRERSKTNEQSSSRYGKGHFCHIIEIWHIGSELCSFERREWPDDLSYTIIEALSSYLRTFNYNDLISPILTSDFTATSNNGIEKVVDDLAEADHSDKAEAVICKSPPGLWWLAGPPFPAYTATALCKHTIRL